MFHLELKITMIQSSDPSQSCCISSNFIRHNEMLHNHIIWVCRALVFIFLGLVGLINMWKVSKNAYFYRILKISHGGHLGFERLQNSSPTVSAHLNMISDIEMVFDLTAFILTPVWTKFFCRNFAPTYFRMLPYLIFGSDFLLLA